jgi:hypothetical protein
MATQPTGGLNFNDVGNTCGHVLFCGLQKEGSLDHVNDAGVGAAARMSLDAHHMPSLPLPPACRPPSPLLVPGVHPGGQQPRADSRHSEATHRHHWQPPGAHHLKPGGSSGQQQWGPRQPPRDTPRLPGWLGQWDTWGVTAGSGPLLLRWPCRQLISGPHLRQPWKWAGGPVQQQRCAAGGGNQLRLQCGSGRCGVCVRASRPGVPALISTSGVCS